MASSVNPPAEARETLWVRVRNRPPAQQLALAGGVVAVLLLLAYLLFAGPGGWLVVDTGRHPAHAQAILAAVHDSGRPIRHVLNTHWHLDHVGGNPALRAAHPGLRVLASPAIHGARAGFLAGYADQLRGPLRANKKTCIDEYPLPARHEGVEAVVLNEHNRHRFGVQAGDLPDRRDHRPDVALDLGVADEIELTLLRIGGTKRRQRSKGQTGQRQAEEGDDASIHGWRAG